MSRLAEPNAGFAAPERSAEDRWLEARGYTRCEHCGQLLPLIVSRCRRRRCPAYAPTWARDTMRKIRVNLQTYGGLSCVVAVTAPGEEAGLIWDRSNCRHTAAERCSGPRGCRVVEKAAAIWNEGSRGWWRELNRLCKQRADRAIRRLGAETKGGVLMYEWELQMRGVWHLHVVHGMETAIERAWAYEYVAALSELAESKGFGWVDRKPLRAPRPAEQAANYLSKYLAKWQPDGSLELTETVKSAGPTLLNYVSRRLTAKSGCTMRNLRIARIVWAWLSGLIEDPGLDPWDELVAVCLLDRLPVPVRGP